MDIADFLQGYARVVCGEVRVDEADQTLALLGLGGGSQLFALLGDALPTGLYLYYFVDTSTTSVPRRQPKAFSQLLSMMHPGIRVTGKFFDRCGKRTFNEVG